MPVLALLLAAAAPSAVLFVWVVIRAVRIELAIRRALKRAARRDSAR